MYICPPELGSLSVVVEIDGTGADDLYVASATWNEGPNEGDTLSDDQIAWIEKAYAEDIYMDWLEQQIGRAEDRAEGMER